MQKETKENSYIITESGRIDKILAHLTNFSRSKIQEFIEQGLIEVNQKKVLKPNLVLEVNDHVLIQEPQVEKYLDEKVLPFDYELEVLYEDEYFLVINKPSGYLTHPTQYNEQNTILNMAINYFIKHKIKTEPWIVHRLDKDTSGIMMIAKGYEALVAMQKIFNERDVTKKYYALVHHCFHEDKTILIDVPIARSFQHKLKMNPIHGKNPKPAQTQVEILANYQQAALISCDLLTGRTHQIRVHLRHINHPIINDELYGIEKATTPFGQYLHAYFLSFTHPFTKQLVQLEIKMPQEFELKIKELKNSI